MNSIPGFKTQLTTIHYEKTLTKLSPDEIDVMPGGDPVLLSVR